MSAPNDHPVGITYLLHFKPGYKHARHYVGWTEGDDVAPRLARHAAGQGGRLCSVVVGAGSELVLARTWPGTTRAFERKLHRRHGAVSLCPICNPAGAMRRAS
jgi:hypothetical protein